MNSLKPKTDQRELLTVWGLFALLAYFPLFLNLDVLPLRIWDEARLAVSAFEMTMNHHFLVTYYDGVPDMVSTKPPLLIWCQAFLFKIMGPGELALRLPSAICALLTGAALVYACWKWLQRPWMGLMAALILVTSAGYVDMHVARSGDYDSMLTLFVLIIVLCVYRYGETRSRKALTLLFVSIAGAILTKSIQGLMILPGCALYLLLTGAWRDFLKEKRTWLGLLGVVIVTGAYFLGREAAGPGYLKAVWENDLGGRFGTVLSGHEGPWSLFLERFMHDSFNTWYLLVPCGIVIGLANRDPALRRWTLILTSAGSFYLIAISSAATKCNWYDAPLYPLLAGIAAIALHAVFTWIRDLRPFETRINVAPFLALFLVFVLPYSAMFNSVYNIQERSWEKDFYQPIKYVQDATRGKRELKAEFHCFDGLNAPILFYGMMLRSQGQPFNYIDKTDLKPGQRVMVSDWQTKEYIAANYTFSILDSEDAVNVYEITGEKHE